MAKPINLNRVRKTKARADDKARADTNSVKFGQSKAVKSLETARRNKADHDLDGHKKDP